MPQDRVDQIISVSRALRNAAGKMLDHAFQQSENGQLSQEAYRQFYEQCYLPIVRHAVDMLIDESYHHGSQLGEHLDAIAAGTRELQSALDNVEQIGEVVEFGARVLTAAASVAAFVALPSAGTGLTAAQAIAEAVGFVPG